jgi:uncharacterized protein
MGTPAEKAENLTILVKPASSLCDLRCRYCFYHSIADNRGKASYGVMPRETASALIGRALEASRNVTFSFQGGEPTLAGLDFFRFFAGEVNRLNGAGIPVNYAMQTNGAGMTEEFAGFLKEHGLLVGLSLDGPAEINDWMRVDAEENGSFKRIMSTAELFQRLGVPFNILCVVTSATARHIEKVYRFFRRRGFHYLQFIPCLDPLDEEPFSYQHSLTPELYAQFLTRLFRLWADDVAAGRGASIRFFDNLMTVAAGYPPEQCGMKGRCGGQFVVEGDGSIFPCDFYCTDAWRIGNIRDMTLQEAYASPAMQEFIRTSVYDDPECLQCRYWALCRGGCRRDRDAKSHGSAGPNRYCAALKQFFDEAAPRLPELLGMLAARRTQ